MLAKSLILDDLVVDGKSHRPTLRQTRRAARHTVTVPHLLNSHGVVMCKHMRDKMLIRNDQCSGNIVYVTHGRGRSMDATCSDRTKRSFASISWRTVHF